MTDPITNGENELAILRDLVDAVDRGHIPQRNELIRHARDVYGTPYRDLQDLTGLSRQRLGRIAKMG